MITMAGGLCSRGLVVIWTISGGVGRFTLFRESLVCVGDGSCSVSEVLLRSLLGPAPLVTLRIDGARLGSLLVHCSVIWCKSGLRFSSPGI